ncbi:MAG: hybrid sensor histidine kinase/response regulator, partial [bacterium]|nr:hybrid sensor histidine kinase/response regulator [bacterium]
MAEADRLKSEFLSNMSHELRTPLNSVLALSQLMISRGLGKDLEQESEYLGVIERNGRQLLELINDILNLSKIEAGRQEVFPADVEPGAVAAMALATAGPLAGEKGLTATLHASDGLPVVCSDRDKVRQILLNLLSNAVKFTETGGVELTVSPTVGGVAFAVTDTGQGIAQADVTKVFDEFRQLDGSTTRKQGGTGL